MLKTLIYDGMAYQNFEIDECGNIRNVKTGNVYKFCTDKSGYLRVSLPMGKRGKVKIVRVHKAVAETFLPNPNNYPVVHHRDENKQNPHISNLEWVTHKQNIAYHWEKASDENVFCNNRKLTLPNIKHIRESKGVVSATKLASIYNVSKTTIINVQKYRCYANMA